MVLSMAMQYHLLNLFVSIFNSVLWPLNINAMQFPETPSMKMEEIERECYFHFCEMKLSSLHRILRHAQSCVIRMISYMVSDASDVVPLSGVRVNRDANSTKTV